MSTRCPLSVLLGIVVATPVLAQELARSTPHPPSPKAALVAAHMEKDTSVIWVEIRSQEGKLRGQFAKLFKAEMAKARALGRTPFLEYGATWCAPCQELEQSIHNANVVDAFSGAYVIHVDVNEWDQDELEPFGFKGGGIPALMALNKSGKIIGQMDHVWRGVDNTKPIKDFVQAHLWKVQTGSPKIATR